MFFIITTILPRELTIAFPLAVLPEVCFRGVHALPHPSLLEAWACRIKPYCDLQM